MTGAKTYEGGQTGEGYPLKRRDHWTLIDHRNTE